MDLPRSVLGKIASIIQDVQYDIADFGDIEDKILDLCREIHREAYEKGHADGRLESLFVKG